MYIKLRTDPLLFRSIIRFICSCVGFLFPHERLQIPHELLMFRVLRGRLHRKTHKHVHAYSTDETTDMVVCVFLLSEVEAEICSNYQTSTTRKHSRFAE